MEYVQACPGRGMAICKESLPVCPVECSNLYGKCTGMSWVGYSNLYKVYQHVLDWVWQFVWKKEQACPGWGIAIHMEILLTCPWMVVAICMENVQACPGRARHFVRKFYRHVLGWVWKFVWITYRLIQTERQHVNKLHNISMNNILLIMYSGERGN